MPDLLLWRTGSTLGHKQGAPAEPEQAALASTCEARWVEVKGPGDSLRSSQRAWLSLLTSWGAHVEVVYVTAISPN